MFVCPVDLQWCDRPGCAAGICEMAGEPRLFPCTACGVLIVRAVANGFCVECITVESTDHQAGG